MHALILAGGRGERLRPLTDTTPKPLLPLGAGLSTLEVLLHKCADEGVGAVTLALGYRAHDIMAYIDTGTRYGLENIRYCIEPAPLGTAGPIQWMTDAVAPFLVLNSDTLFTFSLRALYTAHMESRAALTMATLMRRYTLPYGVVHINGNGQVDGLDEKPTYEWECFLGASVCSPEIVSLVPSGAYLDMPDLVNTAWKKHRRLDTWCLDSADDWHDIGTPASYNIASNAFLANPTRYGGSLCPQY